MERAVISALVDRCVDDPSSAIERAELWEVMLRGLSMPQRMVIVLKCRHSLTFGEIGLAIGLSSSGANRVFLETIAILRASGKYQALLN